MPSDAIRRRLIFLDVTVAGPLYGHRQKRLLLADCERRQSDAEFGLTLPVSRLLPATEWHGNLANSKCKVFESFNYDN